MCGIAGFLFHIGPVAEPLEAIASRMAQSLQHRGPDGCGVWVDRHAAAALAHRRLAILDLSPAGKQPMLSRSGRYCIAFNGEVYNFRELRQELESSGATFRGHSDTEVLVEAIDAWGLRAALARAVGMFAFAVWDRVNRELYIARDRVGEKPLYWAAVGSNFAFASELKALKVFPGFAPGIDRGSAALLLRHNYVPAPRTIYEGVFKLPPGCFMRVIRQPSGELCIDSPVEYWSVERVFREARHARFSGTFEEAAAELDRLLRRTLSAQMISDVPLGAFLSGGIDSSTVVAIMQSLSARPVKTFTIGFHEAGFDEAAAAREVAKHLGTDHVELYVTPREAIDVIPRLPEVYDEPFADSSQIPTFLVCSLARRDVTVALSGDGGDELFCGYNRYIWARDTWRWLGLCPPPLRRALSSAVRSASPGAWDRLLRPISCALPRALRYARPGDRLHKFAELLEVDGSRELYQRFQSHWMEPSSVVVGSEEPGTRLTQAHSPRDLEQFTEQMSILDFQTYLPDDILVKVDRAAMAVSLEGRMPLLDHRIIEFAAALPIEFKLRGRKGKLVLRKVLDSYVPRALIDRPKTGFGLPIDSWLRGPLREWAEELLSPAKLSRYGLLRPEPVRALWDDHMRGTRSWHYHLWDVLMLQAWLEENERSVSHQRLASISAIAV